VRVLSVADDVGIWECERGKPQSFVLLSPPYHCRCLGDNRDAAGAWWREKMWVVRIGGLRQFGMGEHNV
jgi:hypothetical protein